MLLLILVAQILAELLRYAAMSTFMLLALMYNYSVRGCSSMVER